MLCLANEEVAERRARRCISEEHTGACRVGKNEFGFQDASWSLVLLIGAGNKSVDDVKWAIYVFGFMRGGVGVPERQASAKEMLRLC